LPTPLFWCGRRLCGRKRFIGFSQLFLRKIVYIMEVVGPFWVEKDWIEGGLSGKETELCGQGVQGETFR